MNGYEFFEKLVNNLVDRWLILGLVGLSFGLALFSLSSCAIKKRFTGVGKTFLEDVDINSVCPNLPFQHCWVSSEHIPKYSSVYFKPIRLDFLSKGEWKKSASSFVTSEQDYNEKVKEVAQYFHSELIEKTVNFKDGRFVLATTPGPDSIIVEIALTELELSRPVARAAALAVPIPGAGQVLSSVTDPHVAFAARITDGVNGKLIATAADRKYAPTRLIDFNKLTVSSSAREISSIWADTIVASLQGDKLSKIKEKNFDWKFW